MKKNILESLSKYLMLMTFIVAMTTFVIACSNTKMTIGVMVPLTGDAAAYGNSVKKGVELAIEELGADNIEVIFEDSLCDARTAINAVNKLITVNDVVAIIGELCSSATLAVASTMETNGVVLLSPASTSPDITDAGDYIFRDVPSDAHQGVFAAELVYGEGNNSIALLFPNEDYGQGFSSVMSNAFIDFGGAVLAMESFNRGDTDLRSQITKIKNTQPDAIFIISNSPDAASASIRQITELGVKARLYGSEGLKDAAIAQTPGAEGLIISSVSTGTEEFNAAFMKKFNEAPGPFSAQGYDAFHSLFIAIEAGAQDSEGIKNELYTLSFDGVTGRVDYDENGDVAGGYELFVVKNGEFVPLPQ